MIKKRIETGEYRTGEQLPTEQELCKTFGISRTPVRQALNELTHEGILYRKPGLGTFVSDFSLFPSSDNMRIKVMIPEERWATILQKAVELWNMEHHEEQVKLEILIAGHSEFQFKLIHSVAGGNAPDISLMDSVCFAQFARDFFILPLDDIDPVWINENYKKDFFQACVDGSTYDDQIYTLYLQTDMALIWYRKDWFENEGITPPETWDELVWVAQYFQREAIRNRYRIGSNALTFTAGLKAGETTTYQLLPILWSTGADIFKDNRIILDNEATRRALAFLRDLVHRYKVASADVATNEWNDAMRQFALGDVALAFGGSYERTLIQDASGWNDEEFARRVGFFTFPAGPGGNRSTIVGGMGFAVYRQTKQPKLALEILKLATGPRLMKEFCQTTNQNPGRISVHRVLDTDRESFLSRTSQFLYNARMRPILPEYSLVSEQLQAMTENVITERMTVKDAVTKAAEIISAIARLPLEEGSIKAGISHV